MIAEEKRNPEIIKVVSDALKQIAEDNKFSSVHVLLAEKEEIESFSNNKLTNKLPIKLDQPNNAAGVDYRITFHKL